jgi:hypothetical protein
VALQIVSRLSIPQVTTERSAALQKLKRYKRSPSLTVSFRIACSVAPLLVTVNTERSAVHTNGVYFYTINHNFNY